MCKKCKDLSWKKKIMMMGWSGKGVANRNRTWDRMKSIEEEILACKCKKP